MNILLTGGAGYIGSHTYIALSEAGFTPIILDNFCNSQKAVITRLEKITGKSAKLEEGDVCDENFVEQVLKQHNVKAVVHFAALKAVGESIAKPLAYYQNNVGGLISLLAAMHKTGCNDIVYSSSATVYGHPEKLPITEDAKLEYTNPYGHSKLIGEQMLAALHKANTNFGVAILRYFNPVGAHPSGLIGEDPKGIPNNLMPFICQVASKKLSQLDVFGNDYPTSDGTGIRDYLHVMDLAEGHVAALKYLLSKKSLFAVNLGTGKGFSVLEIIKAFEAASSQKISYRIAPRRAGDVPSCYADASLAHNLLGWSTTRNLESMCRDAWNWQSKNPNGFA